MAQKIAFTMYKNTKYLVGIVVNISSHTRYNIVFYIFFNLIMNEDFCILLVPVPVLTMMHILQIINRTYNRY